MTTRVSWLRDRRIIAALVVLLLIAAALVFRAVRRADAAATATTTTSLATASVQTLSQSVSATGTINPATQSNLRFAVTGTVAHVDVKVGDTVTAGQAVAAVDPTDLQTAVDLAAANDNSARANLATVKASSSTTTTQLAAANSQVAASSAKLATAQANLKAATLVSPITGTVATVNVSAGDQVSGGGTSSGGGSGSGAAAAGSGSSGSSGSSSAQIVVITTDSWVVATSVTSADLPQIKPGLQAQITPTGSRSAVFGTVSTVGVVATSTSGVATFPVTVAVTGSPKGLYAGSSATVSIIVKEIADAIAVPTAAIRTENGQTVVSKMVGGVATTTPVQLGLVQGNLTQVTSGLAEGDQVVVEGRTAGGGQQSTGTRTRGGGGFTGGGQGFPGGGQGGIPQGAPAGGGNP